MRATLIDGRLRLRRKAMRRTTSTCGRGRLGFAALLAVIAMLVAPALAAGEEAPAASTPVNTSAPTLSGTPAPGQTLTCSQGVWSGNPNGFSYAWLRDGVPIPGQSASTYVVQSADQGHSISCQVTAANGGGEYAIVGLPSGSYKVSFFAFEGNYVFQYFNGQPSQTTATPVAVTAPNVASGVNAEMHAGGQIAGKVTAAAGGAAAAEVLVCAFEENVGNGCASTNGAGEYAIVGLPSGSYTVTFYPFEGNLLSQSYTANPVAVTAGSTTPNVNAALAAGGQISGRLTAETGGGAIAGAEACAYEPTSHFFGNCANTNGNGEYTIQGLPSGSTYEVRFIAFGCSEAGCTQQNYLEKIVTGVLVTAGSTTPNVNAALATGGQISGTVSGPEGGGGVEVCADEPTEGFFECATTNAGGAYTIPALNTGEYNVVFFPLFHCGTSGCMRTNYLTQSYSSPVAVTAGSTVSGINATMSAAGKISGRITAESGGGAVAGEACAYEPVSHFYGGCAGANANGEYIIQGLASGSTYEVTFYGFGCLGGTCAQQNYISKKVTGIAVTAGSTTPNVNAALQTGGQIAGRVTDAVTHAGIANALVCAFAKIGSGEEEAGGCTTTNGAAHSAAAARSNALSVPAPNSSFKLIGKPKFNAKTGMLVFTFSFPNAGKLSWALFFKNSDVGFADSLGISLGEGGAVAEAAKKHKKCKKGFKKHKGRCVRVLVPFSSGSTNVAAGTVTVSAHASSKALKALKKGRTLHVSGTFTFQSSLGGKPASLGVSTVVHPPKKKGKHRKHHRG